MKKILLVGVGVALCLSARSDWPIKHYEAPGYQSKPSQAALLKQKKNAEKKLPRYSIAIAMPALTPFTLSLINGFTKTLEEEALFEAEFRYYDANADRILMKSQAEDIFSSDFDLIYSIGHLQTKTLQEIGERRSTTTPIIFSSVKDPVNLGIVTSLEKPGANITGILGDFHCHLYINLLITLHKPKTVLIVHDPLGQQAALDEFKNTAQRILEARNIKTITVEIFNLDDLTQRTESNLEGVDLVITLPSSIVTTGLGHLVKLCNTYGIPLAASTLDASGQGATIAFGVSEYQVGALAAQKARMMLEQKKLPGDIPVSDIGREWKLLVNTKAAKRQHFTLDKTTTFLMKHTRLIKQKTHPSLPPAKKIGR